jgi:hypothetical protein
MMTSYAKGASAELKPYIGSMNQLARIRTSVLDDGRGRGMRVADVDNGSGLRFSVLIERGLDIGDASFKGVPFVYQTPVGLVNPAHFESDGFRWLRSFGGGLLTGCGLRHAGSPESEQGMRADGPLGLHGRLSNTPAENVAIEQGWVDGLYRLAVSGTVREVSFFGENLELRRTISTAMGDNSITVSDVVVNRGVRPSPLMVLYHINIGFPLVSEDAVLDARVLATTPRNADAQRGLGDWSKCQKPTSGIAEQCFYHDIEAGADGMARMTMRNEAAAMAIEIAYRKAELPFFTQWKMMGEQEYVVGLEPGNCHPEGQSAEIAKGSLKTIAPDESVSFKTVITLRSA